MYIFDILKKLKTLNSSFNSIMKYIYNIPTESIEDKTISGLSINNFNGLKETITDISEFLDSQENRTNDNKVIIDNDIHQLLIKDVSEIYQYKNLLSYATQKFIDKRNNEEVPYIIKHQFDDNNSSILFNTGISTDTDPSKVLIYSTTIDNNGVFKNKDVPFVSVNGFYHINIKINLNKKNETSDTITYVVEDNNGYITAIAYI